MSFSEVNVFFNDECNIITLFYYDIIKWLKYNFCLLYTSDAADE